MALKGVKVVEIAGLAPVPFCGMMLADFGADVIRVDKTDGNSSLDCLAYGKKSIAINLKSKEGIEALLKMLAKADVVIEPFRPGVMEKLGLGPDQVTAFNPRIIYARLTGFGQTGPYSKMAGHDVNYAALSGALSIIGRKDEAPIFPGNILADFAGGGLMCAIGIAFAIIDRYKTGKGQIVDCAMMDGAAYLSSFIYRMKHLVPGFWDGERGTNMLDSGAHFYEVYKTKDGKYISVGAIEPQFYAALLEKMRLSDEEFPHQMDKTQWPAMKERFRKEFLKKTRDEWETIFMNSDACVAPVLDMEETHLHPHNQSRSLLASHPDGNTPNPAPRLSRTPGNTHLSPLPFPGQHSISILEEYGFSTNEITQLIQSGAINQYSQSKL